jgi:hypothetical protein
VATSLVGWAEPFTYRAAFSTPASPASPSYSVIDPVAARE